jgi:DNA-binding transcriptional ArsR family regulator
MSAKRNYLLEEKNTQIALLGRALSHELRVEILSLLLKNKKCRCIDLAKQFKTSRSTIHHHLEFLKMAKIVSLEYQVHYYLLSIPKTKTNLISTLIHHKQLSSPIQ